MLCFIITLLITTLKFGAPEPKNCLHLTLAQQALEIVGNFNFGIPEPQQKDTITLFGISELQNRWMTMTHFCTTEFQNW